MVGSYHESARLHEVYSVSVTVDSHLHIDGNQLGQDLVEEIFDELTIPNQAKVIAEHMQKWGWEDLPDDFLLADIDGDEIILPRGYLTQLKMLLRENDMRVQLHDKRRRRRGKRFKWRKSFTPREHQPEAVKALCQHQQGMYEAPTGSGKTMTCVQFVHDVSPSRTLVLVDKLELLNQWLKEFRNWLGSEHVGQVGSGKWVDDKRITVATVQTIWSAIKRGTLSDEFFDQFDCVILDECHHVSAETFQKIVSRFSAKWRFGVSATPDRKDDKFEFALCILGEVFYADDEDELRERGVLVKPHVEVTRTSFEFTYWGDHESDDEGECDVPGCKKDYMHRHKNNYQALKDALVSDPNRNSEVAFAVRDQIEEGLHHHLIISNEVRHLEAIKLLVDADIGFGPRQDIPVFMLTGRLAKKKREQMIEDIKASEECVVLATVAKEGLDIPAIDRVYLPWPDSNPKVTQQKIGRATRTHNGKDGAIVIDFLDPNVGILKKQFRKRRYQCYDKLGLEVIL